MISVALVVAAGPVGLLGIAGASAFAYFGGTLLSSGYLAMMYGDWITSEYDSSVFIGHRANMYCGGNTPKE